jgi:hypothetical protein
VCSDYGAVDDGANLIELELQLFEDVKPLAAVRPVGEPIVNRFPRPKPFWQVPPGHSGLGSIQYRIDELPIATLGLGSLPRLGKELADSGPLFVCQRVTMHG